MNAVPRERIVAGRTRNAFGMPAFRVRATDYPEVKAEGRTPDEACDRLIVFLDGPSTRQMRHGNANPPGAGPRRCPCLRHRRARAGPDPSATVPGMVRPVTVHESKVVG